MQLFDPNNPNEKKKLIAAAVLGVAAIAVLGYVFFSGGSTKPTNQNVAGKSTPRPSARAGTQIVDTPEDPSSYTPVRFGNYVPAVPEANRNIFAYYVPPPSPSPVAVYKPPSPTPTPPLEVYSLAPSSVYARTADFSLQVTGDKFTPAVRVVFDGRELQTRFISNQQLFATVPAVFINNPGTRNVMVKSSDGVLYSRTVNFGVTPPPTPNYNYVGLIGKPRSNDTAVMMKKGDKEVLNVQRGDVLEGRFRVTSISEREIVLVDTTLKIRHTIAFSQENSTNQPFRQPVRTSDDEPM